MLFKTLELFVRKVNFIVVYVVADVIFNKITFKLACSGRLDMPPLAVKTNSYIFLKQNRMI